MLTNFIINIIKIRITPELKFKINNKFLKNTKLLNLILLKL